MTEPAEEFFFLSNEDAERIAMHGPIQNGGEPDAQKEEQSPIVVETWADFERSATDHIPTIVDGLWPEHAFGFIAAPPKKGKTWLGLSLAISVAAGVPAFGRFTVPAAHPVIYLALEGHKAAIRGRIGCLARGMGLNPDQGGDLHNLHIIYKPRGINLAAASWVALLKSGVQTVKPALLVVDVLRAAATIKESSNDDFTALRKALEPISDDGVAIALLHHFGKLTEINKERSAGERMSGAGAMYGALDAGIYITGSDDGARKLRVEFDLRDLATPEPMGLHLAGTPTGINGGFVYNDAAYWTLEEAPDEDELEANAAAVIAWLELQPGRSASQQELAYAFEVDPRTIVRRRHSYVRSGIQWEPARGQKPIRYWLARVDTDRVDTCPPKTLSTQETLDLQEEFADSRVDTTRVDTALVHLEESADLQEEARVDRVDSPTESSTSLSGHWLTDADIEALGVDLDRPADPPESDNP